MLTYTGNLNQGLSCFTWLKCTHFEFSICSQYCIKPHREICTQTGFTQNCLGVLLLIISIFLCNWIYGLTSRSRGETKYRSILFFWCERLLVLLKGEKSVVVFLIERGNKLLGNKIYNNIPLTVIESSDTIHT